MKKFILTFTFVLTAVSLFAQHTLTFIGESLMIPASPNSMAMAQSSLSSNYDPMMPQFNPANVVDFQNSFNLISFTNEKNWFPYYAPDLKLYSFGLSASYNISEFTNDIPLFISVGYMRSKFDEGYNTYSNEMGKNLGEFNTFNTNNQFTIGVGLNYLIKTSFGFSITHFYSKIGNNLFQSDGNPTTDASVNTYNFGIKSIFPLISISEKILGHEIEIRDNLIPVFDFTFGSSFLNYGKEIYFDDPNQGDPMPRNARLGYSFKLGIDYQMGKSRINVFETTINREVIDYLVGYKENNDSSSSVYYKSFASDVKIIDNFILGKSNENIHMIKAFEIGFAESLYLRGGNLVGYGWDHGNNLIPSGFSITTRGLFKLINESIDLSPEVQFVIDHIELQYHNVKYKTEMFNFTGSGLSFLSLTFKGF